MLNIIMSIIALTANQEYDTHIWSVEYDGQIYTYEATAPNSEGAYIITLDGEKIYVRDVIGGEKHD